MNARRAFALAGGLAWWAMAGTQPGRAQAIPPQPDRYLLTTEASDARALWVNPAGLARVPEASIGADLTLDRFFPGGAQLSQYGLSLAGHGIAASWIHERFPPRLALNIYAVGIGLGNEQFSAGTTRRWFTGAATASSWDVGARVSTLEGTQLSLVVRNVGSPRLLDSTYWATAVPGALVSLLSGTVQLGGEWQVTPHTWRSVGYRAGGTVALGRGLALLLRADLTPSFKRRALVVALGFDASGSRAGAFASASGGANEVDAVGLSGALVTRGTPRR